MLPEIVEWPYDFLVPATADVNPVPFSRSGGRTLGGIERVTRTDRGYWSIRLNDVTMRSDRHRKTWNAIRVALGGRAGLIAVPAWSLGSAPHFLEEVGKRITTKHSDKTPHSDGSPYLQTSIQMEVAAFAPLGSAVATIRIIRGTPEPSGIRFSYNHALYETGRVIEQMEHDIWRVELGTTVRMPIPAGARLEADQPTCLCHLRDDRGMDLGLSNHRIDGASVEFVEAVDYWNDLALEST